MTIIRSCGFCGKNTNAGDMFYAKIAGRKAYYCSLSCFEDAKRIRSDKSPAEILWKPKRGK